LLSRERVAKRGWGSIVMSVPPSLAIPPASLEIGEMLGWGGLLCLGGVLQWLSAVHPAALPFWAPWDFSWPVYLATTASLWWFVRGIQRATSTERLPRWRQCCFLLGLLAIYGVLQTRFEYMSQHMFFLNRFQHLAMHHLGPFLIAVAGVGETLRRGMPEPARSLPESRPVRLLMAVVQQPIVAALIFVGLIYFWLIPAVQFRAMLNPDLYDLMNWSMVVDGLLFWCLVLDRRPKPQARLSFGTRMFMAVLVMFPQIALGSYITFTGRDLYAYYDLCGRLYPSIGPLLDQHLGGLIAWVPASMMSSVAFMLTLNNLRLHEEAQPEAPAEENPPGLVLDASAWTGR
jgi:putative membrane protein